jgi:lysophospholipase L1-like esterase
MHKKWIFLLIACFAFNLTFSQSGNFKWWNPAKNDSSVIEGQAWPNQVANDYDRLPAYAEKAVRAAVWNLSRQAAGLMIRFRSNAGQIRVRYSVGGKLELPHMPATGVSGVDLYSINKDGGSEWSGGKFNFGDTIEYSFQSLKNDYVREYRLYLPLYNSVKWLEIGVPDGAVITALPVRDDLPIVVYGTSIAQGACASRPGMAWPAILGRTLDRPVINLGFSGNGKLEVPLINMISQLDAKIFVLDCLPNLTGLPADTVRQKLIYAVKALKKAKPSTPVLVVEHADAAIQLSDSSRNNDFNKVNETARLAFEELKVDGITGIYYLPAKNMGLGIESTVEGLHPNDVGMIEYATGYADMIRDILKEKTGEYSTMQPCIQYRDKVYDWEARHRELLKLNKKDPPKIVFLGNSITHFWGGEPQASISRGSDSWKKTLDPVGVRNFGYGWDRVENVLWRVYHGELDGYKARQVIIMIGTNNIGFNSDTEILAGLKLLIHGVKDRQPEASILLLGIFPRRGQEPRVYQLNEGLVQLAASENVNYANPGSALSDQSGKIRENLFVDGLHPNTEGYRLLANGLKNYLVK